MIFIDGPVTVTVPATSANLGPGFDSLGVALGLRDALTAEVVDGPLRITVEGQGAGQVPLDERHLVRSSMVAAFEEMGVDAPAVALHCVNVVPHARGLGSSSAAIVGGIVLARALVVRGTDLLDDSAALALANRIEGHPDNVAPALLGGFTIAASTERGIAVARYDVDSRVDAVVLVPDFEVSTEAARGLLPATVPHADAALNAGRAALLVAALTGRPDLLHAATEDRLHQQYRRAAMPQTLDLVDNLRARGVAAAVSGAGPTVLVLTTADADEVEGLQRAGWTAHRPGLGGAGARIEPPVLA